MVFVSKCCMPGSQNVSGNVAALEARSPAPAAMNLNNVDKKPVSVLYKTIVDCMPAPFVTARLLPKIHQRFKPSSLAQFYFIDKK